MKAYLSLSVSCLLISLLFNACRRDEQSVYHSESNDYLPLQIGNTWHFSQSLTLSTEGEVKRIVDSKKEIDGHEYFLILTNATCLTCNSVTDSIYYRIDQANGYVYSRRPKSTNEDNWFRLNAKDKDTWSYVFNTDEKATITVTEPLLTLNGTTLPDCKAYYYDVDKWADEEYTRTLAKGIGFVEEYSNAWGGKYVLTSAKIDGKTIAF